MDFLAASTTVSQKLDWVELAWFAFSAAVFAFVVRRIFQQGGRVDVTGFGHTENWLALSLGCWFLLLGIVAFTTTEPEPKSRLSIGDLVAVVAMSLVLILGIVLSLKSKGRSLNTLFGFNRQPIWKAFVFALVFMFASYPLVSVGALVTQTFSKGPDDLQEMVKYFREAAHLRERIAVVVSAVVVAPVIEELFFRGIIYGVAKRYGGMIAAIIFNAAFFAFIHGSLPIFGALFVLAVCLSLAYELTGSLYVPIFMHACFNAAELVLIFLGVN